MKQQTIKGLEPTCKHVSRNLVKETEKSKKIFDENKILRKERGGDKQRIKLLILSREQVWEKNNVKSIEIKVLRNKLKPKRHVYTILMIQLSAMLRAFTNSRVYIA